MTRKIIALIGLALLAGCSGGGGDSATPSSAPAPLAQPDILTATDQGLQRGTTNGQDQRLIFAQPNLYQGNVFLSGTHVYYHKNAPSIFFDYPNQDIWSVRTDGTGDHAVLNTTANEFVKGASGDVAIYEQGIYTQDGIERAEHGSLRDGSPWTTLPIPTPLFTGFRLLSGSRAFFNNEQQVFSINLDGSGLSTHATVAIPVSVGATDAFSNTLVYREMNFPQGTAALHTTPISGGGSTPLSNGQTYNAYAGHVGSRVVAQVCAIEIRDGLPMAGACDVESIDVNGSGRAILASQSANEAVQGIAGNQVIVRRNLAGNDQLIAVPVTGGPERLLMTMTDSEFVQLTGDDFMIIRRPSGVWTLDLNGTLKQIGTVLMDFGLIVAGNAICGNSSSTAWCMPLDGSTPAVKIADVGRVIGAL